LGWKTRRVHHKLSGLELAYFYVLEWSLKVVDIREQFPLWTFEETQEIAKALGIKYPSRFSGWVMTSDFCLTVQKSDNEFVDVVRTIKPSEILSESRTIELFEIERAYWQRRQTDWAIVTELEIPSVPAKNVALIHSSKSLDGYPQLLAHYYDIRESLTEQARTTTNTLSKVCQQIDKKLQLQSGASLRLVYHLIATRQWIIDMNQPINPSVSLEIQEVNLQ
jgi:hypothetical protein